MMKKLHIKRRNRLWGVFAGKNMHSPRFMSPSLKKCIQFVINDQ